MNRTTLILPGIGGSAPDHWQSVWEKRNPSFLRVQQRDWDHPVCNEWVEALESAVVSVGDQTILVAHSLGCLLVAHWAAKTECKIRGALLVAPPDPDGDCFPTEAVGFSPLPMQTLKFPSTIVASSDDPFARLEFAKSVASSWESRFVNVGQKGHINSDSGLGSWDEGFEFYRALAENR
jgi:hypothetical protein